MKQRSDCTLPPTTSATSREDLGYPPATEVPLIDPVMMFQSGGPFMYLLLLGCLVSPLFLMACLVASLMRVRVPLLIWAAPMAGMVLVGLVGAGVGMGQTLDALATAETDVRPFLAPAGHSTSLFPTLAGWFAAGALFTAATWASALGHLRPDEETGWTLPAAAGLAIGGFVLGWFVILYSVLQQQQWIHWLIGLVTLTAGMGLAPMALRSSEHPASRARLVEGRLVTASLALAAPLCMGAAAALAGKIQTLEAAASASVDARPMLMALGEESMEAATSTTGLGTAVLLLLGLALVLPRLRDIPGGRLILHIAGGIALLLPLAATGAWVSQSANSVTAAGSASALASDAATDGDTFATLVMPASPAFASSKIWIPGTRSADDALPEAGQQVLALCGSELVRGPVTVEPVHDPMVDMAGEKSGRLLAGPCDALALFSELGPVTAGDVATWELDPLEVGRTVAVPQSSGTALRARKVGETGYAVDLLTDGQVILLTQHGETDDSSPSLRWAGDLDGDGKLDLLLSQSPKYSYDIVALYLSSAAEEGPVAKVAEVEVMGD